MTPELERARAHLRHCQFMLQKHREFLGQPGNTRCTAFYERDVLIAIDRVWDAQFRAVFEGEPTSERWARNFINRVDWDASTEVSGRLKDMVDGVIIQREVA